MQSGTMKYSRQREAIREYLMSRTDHPTAEAVYNSLKEEYPRISLGTVYRNLSLLVELGEATRLPGIDGHDHFDGNVNPHYHFICENCNAVMDLHMPVMNNLNTAAADSSGCEINGHTAYFYGKCPKCKM